MATVIREATADDIAEVAELYAEMHSFHVRGVPEYLREADDADDDGSAFAAAILRIVSDDLAGLLVADVEGAIVGLAEVYLREDERNPLRVRARYGYLQSLVVHGQFRGRGIGLELLRAAEDWASRRRATEMRLETWEFAGGPLGFYERSGYRTIKRQLARRLG